MIYEKYLSDHYLLMNLREKKGAAMEDNQLICEDCAKVFSEDLMASRCTCGAILLIKRNKTIWTEDWIDEDFDTMWKYHRVLAVSENIREWENITFGEGNTPLSKLDLDNAGILMKLEYSSPSQSYVDRCSAALVTKLKEEKFNKISLLDANPLNLSIAKYAKKANISCELRLSVSSLSDLIEEFRRESVEVDELSNELYKCSSDKHFLMPDYHPYWIEGAKTYAYELWAQLGKREPDIVAFPVEASLLSIGAYYGFMELLENKLIEKIPKFIIVDTLLTSKSIEESKKRSTADSISTVLYEKVKTIIEQTEGFMQSISKPEILQARKALLMRKYRVDEQSAAAYAGCMRYYRDNSIKNETIVVPLSNYTAYADEGVIGDI